MEGERSIFFRVGALPATDFRPCMGALGRSFCCVEDRAVVLAAFALAAAAPTTGLRTGPKLEEDDGRRGFGGIV